MSLQDLTPQLRTRLSRMERAVGWFVLLAFGLLIFGFVYYLYNMAERKGWFLTKAPYFTFVDNATGLRIGDPVKLMGFDAGVITDIQPMPADQVNYNVYVEFQLKSPNYGYIWTEGSFARVASADLLGKRGLEVTRGTSGYPTYVFFPLRSVPVGQISSLPSPWKWVWGQEIFGVHGTNLIAPALQCATNISVAALLEAGHTNVILLDTREERKNMTAMWNYQLGSYEPYTNRASRYWLLSEESPAVTERLEKVISRVEQALPGIFALTNQLAGVLSNSSVLANNLSETVLQARPAISNITTATAQLAQPGALGTWLLPTNINRQLETTLGSASSAMDSANTNLAALALSLSRSLDNLASLTSNLNQQVEVNSNILSGISQTVIHADQFVQGLKRHWLLRSAFRSENAKTNSPPTTESAPLRSPKDTRR
jgi:ABC-type transporter Mla subunit MlaD